MLVAPCGVAPSCCSRGTLSREACVTRTHMVAAVLWICWRRDGAYLCLIRQFDGPSRVAWLQDASEPLN